MPSPRLTRRTALRVGSLSVLSAIAGCSSALGSDTETADTATQRTATERTTTDTPTPTPTTTVSPDSSLSVGSVTVWPQIVGLSSPDSISTYGARDEQFVLATVGGDGPAYDEVELRVGETTTYSTTELPWGAGVDSLYTSRGRVTKYAGSDAGYLLFSVPKPLDADVARIEWDETENAPGSTAATQHSRDLPADVPPVLARSPTAFEIRSFDKPADGGDTLEVTVANVGDVAGTFVGAVNRSGPEVAYTPVTVIRLDVEPGATATETVDEDFGGEATYEMDWRGGVESVEVTGT